MDCLAGQQIFHFNVPSSLMVVPHRLLDFVIQTSELR
jgi:hypothetical protein